MGILVPLPFLLPMVPDPQHTREKWYMYLCHMSGQNLPPEIFSRGENIISLSYPHPGQVLSKRACSVHAG